MTQLAEDDYRDFVVARWPDLEAVARVVVLDPALARRVTTDVLAGLAPRWRESVEDGRPGEQARRLLLSSALGAAQPLSRAEASGPTPVTTTAPGPGASGGAGADDDVVAEALAGALRSLEPLDRVLVAARVVWDASSMEVAALLDLSHTDLAARDATLGTRIAAAHDEARVAAGLAPAPWALERDLDDAVGVLLRGQHDPPDPAALVTDRAGGLRRRRLLVGGVAAAGLAGAGWWVAGSGVAGPGPTPGPTLPGADDPVWDTTRRWPARGPLAGDADVRALVVQDAPPGSRLLWAGDVGDRTVVVASPADISGRAGVRVLLWTGPRGSGAADLRPVALARDALSGVRDAVALVVPQDVGDALLVLGPPTLREAHYAPVITPTPAGGSVRSFTPLGLVDGIGVELVGRGLGPASFVSVGGYQGVPAGTPVLRSPSVPTATPADYARSRRDLVADLTGIPGGLLSTRVVVDSAAAGGLLGDDAGAGSTGSRVLVVHTRTPDDAVVRAVRVLHSSGGGSGSFDAEVAAVVVASEAQGPVLVPLPMAGRTQRFLVVAPGAATARLLSQAGADRPVTRVVRCVGDTAVLSVPDARQEARYRLLLEDDRGRQLYRGLPPDSAELA